jgi:hypothetical protein
MFSRHSHCLTGHTHNNLQTYCKFTGPLIASAKHFEVRCVVGGGAETNRLEGGQESVVKGVIVEVLRKVQSHAERELQSTIFAEDIFNSRLDIIGPFPAMLAVNA